MGLQQFTNNASTTLAASLSAAATSLSVTAGTGALFPAITGSKFFVATLIKANTPTVFEIIRVTVRTGDSFATIVRAQEGTTALAWNAGDTVALLPTAGAFAGFAQNSDLQSQLGNYAIDVGTANAYAANFTPAITAHVIGMPLRVLFQHANTGSSTFNEGAGVAPLLTSNGSALVSGEITASTIGEIVWGGTSFFLIGIQTVSFSQVSGQIAPSQVPQSAVTQYTPQILASAALTGTPTAPTAPAGTSTTQIATTGFAAPGSSLLANGYRKNADGSITQWGQFAYNGGPTTAVITFPLPWPNAMFSLTINGQVSGFQPGIAGPVTDSQVTLDMTQMRGTAQSFYWIAEGH